MRKKKNQTFFIPSKIRRAKLCYANSCLSLGKKYEFSFFMNSFSTLGHSFFSSVNFLLVRDAAGSLQGPALADPLSFVPLLVEASKDHITLNFAKPVFIFP